MKTNVLRKRVYFLVSFCLFTLSLQAARIVSLAPSLTENLLSMGGESQLAGCTSYCKTTVRKTIVANAMNVNVEKVAALKPDLILATELTNPDDLAALRKLGLNVKVYPKVTSFDALCQQFLDLGQKAGLSRNANQVVSTVRNRVQNVRAKKHNIRTMFIQIGANPLWAVIPDTFMDDYIAFLGGTNITRGLRSSSVTREWVLSKNPDAMFIVTMGITAKSEKSRWESFKGLNAAKNHRIYLIDANKACNPSPISFAETLEAMSGMLRQSRHS